MKNIDKKHVLLSMVNGSVLEGFVESMEDEYLKLIEINNQEVIVKISDISFARLGQVYNQNQHEPMIVETPHTHTQEDYSVPMNDVQSPYMGQIQFVRGGNKCSPKK